MLQNHIAGLQHHESFAHMIKEIETMREESIQELHSADIDKISQISGRILAYDEVLELSGWDILKRRFPEV